MLNAILAVPIALLLMTLIDVYHDHATTRRVRTRRFHGRTR